MATDPTITCPECGAEIKLTESLAAPILSAAKAEFAQKLKDERKTIAEEETKKAREAIKDELEGKGKELKEAQELLDKKNEKLAEAQKAQAELLKKERELDDAKREMELTIQKRLGEELAKDRKKTTKEVEEAVRLKMAEKDKVIDDQKKQLAEAQRKLEQGSQQLQGEVQELDLEQTFTAKFPQDVIDLPGRNPLHNHSRATSERESPQLVAEAWFSDVGRKRPIGRATRARCHPKVARSRFVLTTGLVFPNWNHSKLLVNTRATSGGLNPAFRNAWRCS